MKVILIGILVVAAVTVAYAGDIVTMPTANQLKAGQFDVAYYYLGLDTPAPQPGFLQAQTLYMGLTDRIELDVHRYDPEANLDKTSVIVNASFLLLNETAKAPALVVGGRNLGAQETTRNPAVDSAKRSYFICAAKNVTPMTPNGPKLPLIRLHASLGTEDWTLLSEKRHAGLFGGVQALLTPEIGAILLDDGQDLISGLTFTPKKTSLTIKGGGFGKHWWVGLSYAKSLK